MAACVKTVRNFLLEHPGASFHIMSPGGYVDLIPDDVNRLLRGKPAKGHLGDSESMRDVASKDLLSQIVCKSGNDGKAYTLLTDLPA